VDDARNNFGSVSSVGLALGLDNFGSFGLVGLALGLATAEVAEPADEADNLDNNLGFLGLGLRSEL